LNYLKEYPLYSLHPPQDNELIVLETIHHYVEVLDQLFNNVCELDIIFNFTQAYYCLDEVILGGQVQETSKREVLRVCAAQDEMMEDDSALDSRFSALLQGVTRS
jgi:AP-1 complex subunit sigma 1/2